MSRSRYGRHLAFALFIREPLICTAISALGRQAPDPAMARLRPVHEVLLGLSLVTIVGAVAGSNDRFSGEPASRRVIVRQLELAGPIAPAASGPALAFCGLTRTGGPSAASWGPRLAGPAAQLWPQRQARAS